MSLVEELFGVCELHPDQTAIITSLPLNEHSYSYRDLKEYIEQVKNQLYGYNPGSSVAIVIPNRVEFVVAFFGIIAGNLIAAPFNPTLTEEELIYLVKDVEAGLLIICDDTDPKLKLLASCLKIDLIEINLKDQRLEIAISTSKVNYKLLKTSIDGTALLLHTSGTTSKPKLVPITGNSLLNSAKHLINAYSLALSDRILLVMPLFHVHGLVGNLLTTVLSGGTVVIPPKFSASRFMELAGRYQVTWLSSVPTIFQILLAKEEYLPDEYLSRVRTSLRFVRTCSAGISENLFTSLERTFGVPVVQAYGMTESAHLAATGIPGDKTLPYGSVGKVLGRQIKIENETGEICLKGPGIIRKYLRPDNANANAFTSDGYFRTGDLGYIDSDGYLFVQGRIKELINRGGEKINPNEIERIILMHEEVKETACFSLPDPIYGEKVACIVVLDGRGGKTIQEELSVHCQSHLSAFKCPTAYFFVDEIPKSTIGKIQRTYLTHLYGQ